VEAGKDRKAAMGSNDWVESSSGAGLGAGLEAGLGAGFSLETTFLALDRAGLGELVVLFFFGAISSAIL
jgi:hypothetical protein